MDIHVTPGRKEPWEAENKFRIARSKVQRSVDFPLLISNMSQFVLVLRGNLGPTEYALLVTILTLAIIIHIAVGMVLFGLDGKDLEDNHVTRVEYIAFFGVLIVTILNLLAATMIVAFCKCHQLFYLLNRHVHVPNSQPDNIFR